MQETFYGHPFMSLWRLLCCRPAGFKAEANVLLDGLGHEE